MFETPVLIFSRSENNQKYTQKPKKLFFSAPVRARTVLNAFLDVAYMTDVCHTQKVVKTQKAIYLGPWAR